MLLKLGFRCEVAHGYEMQIRPRSGMALRLGIEVIFGTVDSDYRGEVGAIVKNTSKTPHYVVQGDRVAQAVIAPVYMGDMLVSAALSDTERGIGGFGHTGR